MLLRTSIQSDVRFSRCVALCGFWVLCTAQLLAGEFGAPFYSFAFSVSAQHYDVSSLNERLVETKVPELSSLGYINPSLLFDYQSDVLYAYARFGWTMLPMPWEHEKRIDEHSTNSSFSMLRRANIVAEGLGLVFPLVNQRLFVRTGIDFSLSRTQLQVWEEPGIVTNQAPQISERVNPAFGWSAGLSYYVQDKSTSKSAFSSGAFFLLRGGWNFFDLAGDWNNSTYANPKVRVLNDTDLLMKGLYFECAAGIAF